MNRRIHTLFVLLVIASSVSLHGKDRRAASFFFQSGVNYRFPTGKTHYPVSIAWGPHPVLPFVPVISGGFDVVPVLGYTFQGGVIASLSRSGRHGTRIGVGLSSRGLRMEHFDYQEVLDGYVFNQQTDEVRVLYTELDLECAYVFTKGRLRMDLGILGVLWHRQSYFERALNGNEVRVTSPSFLRFREWNPTMSLAYRVWTSDRVDVAVFGAINRRGFKNYATNYWDLRAGIRLGFPFSRK